MKYIISILFIFGSFISNGQKFALPQLASFIKMDERKAEDILQLGKFDIVRTQSRGSSGHRYTYWEYNAGGEYAYLMVDVNENKKMVEGVTLTLNSREEYLKFLKELTDERYKKVETMVYGDKTTGEEFKKGDLHFILHRTGYNNSYVYEVQVCINCTIIYKRTISN